MDIQGLKQDSRARNKLAFIALQKVMAFFITLTLFLFAGFREIGFDRDSLNYSLIIQYIVDLDLKLQIEPTFYIIVYITNYLFENVERSLFLIYALLGVALKMAGIYRLSRIPLLSVFFYINSYYIIHELTQIRVGIASAIFLLAIPDLANRNLKAYLTKTLFASLFHYIALIMLPLYLIHNTKLNNKFYITIPILGIFLSIPFHSFITDNINIYMYLLDQIPLALSHKLIIYHDTVQLGVNNKINILNFYYVSLLIIYYFSIANINKFKLNYDYILIKLLGLSLFTFYLFSPLPVLAFRISEFIGVVIIILLSSIVYIFRQEDRTLIAFLIVIYSFIISINLLFVQNYLDLGML